MFYLRGRVSEYLYFVSQGADNGEMEGEGDLETEESNDERMREALSPLQVKFSANSPRGRRNRIKCKVCQMYLEFL
jgi:hypothetical protein